MMSKRAYPEKPLLAACTAIWRGNKVLLANRSAPPNEGKWAMPGGLVEAGETLENAAIREVREETALVITEPRFLRFHEIISKDDDGRAVMHYVLAIFATRSESGNAAAGDDAARVKWFTLDQLANEHVVDQTVEFLQESAVLLDQSPAEGKQALHPNVSL